MSSGPLRLQQQARPADKDERCLGAAGGRREGGTPTRIRRREALIKAGGESSENRWFTPPDRCVLTHKLTYFTYDYSSLKHSLIFSLKAGGTETTMSFGEAKRKRGKRRLGHIVDKELRLSGRLKASQHSLFYVCLFVFLLRDLWLSLCGKNKDG